MYRRKYLAISGTLIASLAGCSGDSEEIDDPQTTTEETPEKTSEPTGEKPTEETTEKPTEETTEKPTEETTEKPEPTGEPDVVFGERELIIDDSGYSTETIAQVMVKNEGDAASGQLTVKVIWYDADGNFLNDDTGYLPSLDVGETWVAQVTALTTDAEDIEDFEISGEYEKEPPIAPEGMRVQESQIEIEEYSTRITGVAENNRDEEIGYLEAHGKLYDEQGRVIGGNWTNESEIPAGRNWAFEIPLAGRAEARAEEATDHTVLLDANLF